MDDDSPSNFSHLIEAAREGAPESSWDYRKEKLIKRWGRISYYKKNMHYVAGKQFEQWNKYLGVPNIILSVVVGTSLFGTSGLSIDTDSSKYVMLIAGLIALIGAALSGVHQFLDFGGLAQKHIQASTIYDNIVYTIQMELAFPREERENPIAFISAIKTTIQNSERACPSIPMSIHKKFIKDSDKKLDTDNLTSFDLEDTSSNGNTPKNNRDASDYQPRPAVVPPVSTRRISGPHRARKIASSYISPNANSPNRDVIHPVVENAVMRPSPSTALLRDTMDVDAVQGFTAIDRMLLSRHSKLNMMKKYRKHQRQPRSPTMARQSSATRLGTRHIRSRSYSSTSLHELTPTSLSPKNASINDAADVSTRSSCNIDDCNISTSSDSSVVVAEDRSEGKDSPLSSGPSPDDNEHFLSVEREHSIGEIKKVLKAKRSAEGRLELGYRTPSDLAS
jgi:hypothetical protein